MREELVKNIGVKLVACAGLAVFWVVFVWRFWEKGIYALGINAFVFLALFLGFFIWILSKEKKLFKQDFLWIIPLSLIAIGFLIYDNPFLKGASIPVWLFSFVLFYNFSFFSDKKEKLWGLPFLLRLFFGRLVAAFLNILKSAVFHLEFLIPANNKYKKVIAKVLLGLILFLAITLAVLIPLLSSADETFGRAVKAFYEWVSSFLSLPVVYRVLFAVVLSVIFFAVATAWGKEFSYAKKEKEDFKLDSVMAGIVLGGILIIYLLFLGIQFSRLWVGALPFDFKTTETLVKSGFWQLLALTFINIFIYFFVYKKTSPLVQKILFAFVLVSLLLLVSAAQRMGLYVIFYGFSYEKFFASYTVLYCVLFFVWLISQMIANKKIDILKSAFFLFIWMFAVIAIFPVEQFIFRANMALLEREDSRINLFELSMLSPDVLNLVKEHKATGVLDENWNSWLEKQEKIVADKKWYELNIVNLL